MVNYLSVSDLTKYLKLKFDRDPYLERVYLTGQVSNFRRRPTHQYFSLKDDKAVIQATMWAGIYKSLGFALEEGMKLNVVGRIQLYEPGGSYSIVIEKADPDGIGALAVAFEQLKKRLGEAGYFDDRHKQALPQFVSKIGVITSPSGAVIKDIITTVSRRFPGVEILLFPTKVQGDGAAHEVATNIRLANQRTDLDLLIVGRGGGSIEDLWAFNEELVVEAIFESRLPIISSVGHETDTTLADFVADKRAATPTAAAELATPVTKADVVAFVKDRQLRLYQAVQRRLTYQQERVAKLNQSVIFRQPERLYDSYLQRLDKLLTTLTHHFKGRVMDVGASRQLLHQRLLSQDLAGTVERRAEQVLSYQHRLVQHMKHQIAVCQADVEQYETRLLSLDTDRILKRGFALIQKEDIITPSVQGIKVGDELTITLQDGQLDVEVKNVKETNI
ncbi:MULTISPECIES: exodeoxyribonuclease VII large subunit [unclassified Streptococcus]|uniref:exodeoxyribonuclease VII large subunit n=1 Tax=unclassified Streptococcus TaxID=2608887 RepID=UPI00359E750B